MKKKKNVHVTCILKYSDMFFFCSLYIPACQEVGIKHSCSLRSNGQEVLMLLARNENSSLDSVSNSVCMIFAVVFSSLRETDAYPYCPNLTA